MLREAIRFVPDNAEYRFALAQVELKNSMWVARGLDNLKEAARLEPRRAQYVREAAAALQERGRSAEAEPFARRAVDLDPTPENRQLLDRVLAAISGAPVAPAASRWTEPPTASAGDSRSPPTRLRRGPRTSARPLLATLQAAALTAILTGLGLAAAAGLNAWAVLLFFHGIVPAPAAGLPRAGDGVPAAGPSCSSRSFSFSPSSS